MTETHLSAQPYFSLVSVNVKVIGLCLCEVPRPLFRACWDVCVTFTGLDSGMACKGARTRTH